MPRKLLRKTIIVLIWLALWAIAAVAVNQQLLLPSPFETVRALLSLVQKAAFWSSVWRSILRIVAGFLLGIVLGGLLAVLTSRFTWWRDFFAPFLSMVKATPVASFIVLALVWIRTDGVPVFATMLIVLPVAWSNVTAGIASTDGDLLEMSRAFRMTSPQRIRHIYWPSVRPYFLAATTTGMGMAWKAGVAAEVITTPKLSLGRYLYDAKIYLDTPGLFAVTTVVILLSILLEGIVRRISR